MLKAAGFKSVESNSHHEFRRRGEGRPRGNRLKARQRLLRTPIGLCRFAIPMKMFGVVVRRGRQSSRSRITNLYGRLVLFVPGRVVKGQATYDEMPCSVAGIREAVASGYELAREIHRKR